MVDFRAVYGSRAESFEGGQSTVAGGLALSGGGFRAMLFHVGALRRLHEVGALTTVDRISSVSGGSITAARLAVCWDAIAADPTDLDIFTSQVQQPLFDFAGSRIDVKAGFGGLLRPGRSIAQSVATHYSELLEDAKLSDLPDSVRFVFCATNLGTGSLLRFAKPYTADRRVGKRDGLELPLATVVAASAAFPPVLSPMRINLGPDQTLSQQFPGETPELAGTGYAAELELSDGGVYDNLGLQPLEQYHTVLVSDGGGPFQYDDSVETDWLRHMIRAWKVTDNQVRSLRRSHFVTDVKTGRRRGTYWGITTKYSDYARRVLDVHDSWSHYLSKVPTRLNTIESLTRKQLVNFSYCLADAALRTHVVGEADLPEPNLPYPEYPLADSAPDPFNKKPIWRFW